MDYRVCWKALQLALSAHPTRRWTVPELLDLMLLAELNSGPSLIELTYNLDKIVNSSAEVKE